MRFARALNIAYDHDRACARNRPQIKVYYLGNEVDAIQDHAGRKVSSRGIASDYTPFLLIYKGLPSHYKGLPSLPSKITREVVATAPLPQPFP